MYADSFGESPLIATVRPGMAEIAALPWNGYRVISTFSGCGGSCLGYHMAGFRVLWASEFIPAAQQTYMRTIGMSIRDHASEGNLTWTLGEVRSVGTPLSSRTIADHSGSNFDGVICNFDCGAIVGGNGGQNNSGMTVSSGALHWTDLGGGPGAAVTWGNGTQDSGGSFNARPVDLSNYDFVTIRMSATGTDPTEGIQFYMQTGSGFNYQALNDTLPVDGAFHDIVFPLASITSREFVDTNGINLFGHAGDLAISVDSVIYSSVPEPASMGLVGLGILSLARRKRKL